MANTTNQISFANTFNDWVVVTNTLVREHNNLANTTYTKANGVIAVQSSGVGINVSNNMVVGGTLTVNRSPASAYDISSNNIQLASSANVAGNLYVENVSSTLFAAGFAKVGRTLTLSNTGLALYTPGSIIVETDTYANGVIYLQGLDIRSYMNASFFVANSSLRTINGTTGSAIPTYPFGVMSFTSTNGVTITGSGANEIVFNTPQDLQTSASVRFDSFGVGTDPSGTLGEIRAAGYITAGYSDDRLKNRLGVIENALDKVTSLTGFYYEPSDLAIELGFEKTIEVGLSAQDAQKSMPEIVCPAPIDNQYLTLRYERLAVYLVEAIKEIKAQLNEIKEDIENLKK